MFAANVYKVEIMWNCRENRRLTEFFMKELYCRHNVGILNITIVISIILCLSHNAFAFSNITVQEAMDLVARNDDLLVVDVREANEFCDARGHIPCAVNYPYNSGVLNERYTELSKDRDLLIVCRSGNRSYQASVFLSSKGYTQIYNMLGGMNQWDAETKTCNEVECPLPRLYYPHIASDGDWQTEIAIINTSDQTVTGTLRGISNAGQLIDTKPVTLSARSRRQITIAEEFINHINIGYIIFKADSATVQGYMKFYQAGICRAAIPAVKEVNTSEINIPHIASNAQWSTRVSLVNTTSTTKNLTITFNNDQSTSYTLNAKEHRAFDIRELFNNQFQTDIQSAVITNASGIIGLELFGSTGGSRWLDGILLTDKTASTLYYPHVASDDHWWTGIVAYNPAESATTITITPYSAQGTLLTPSTLSIAGKGKYVGLVAGLGLPAQTAWFRIDSTRPLSGFELFGTINGNQLAAYGGNGGTGEREGVFAKIEKNGWTGIAFVNTEADAASVTLTAYNDSGTEVATRVLPVGGHAKVVNYAEDIFSQDIIRNATYIAYSADRKVVGFQLNGTADGMMLDGLPGLAGAN
jgi:rhodanese-related sulfurtransferase